MGKNFNKGIFIYLSPGKYDWYINKAKELAASMGIFYNSAPSIGKFVLFVIKNGKVLEDDKGKYFVARRKHN